MPDVGQDAVGGVDLLAVDVGGVDGAALRADLGLQLPPDMLRHGGLAGAGLPVNQDVARPRTFEGGAQDMRHLVYLVVAVREVLRDVVRGEHAAVAEYVSFAREGVKNVTGSLR